MKTIDLHVHSTVSDGTMTPKDLVLYAKKKGLTAFALTDHDTIDGLAEAMATGNSINMEVIPGIELAAYYQDVELHILGYFIDQNDSLFLQELHHWQNARERRNIRMIERLNDLGFPITIAALQNAAGSKVITRAHYGKWLFEQGYVKNIAEAFQKYIGADSPAYIPRELPTPKDCIGMIHNAKGIAVLAHPFLYSFSEQELHQTIQSLVKDDLDGLEVIYSTHTPKQEKLLRHLASHYGLLQTGGSDFHGHIKPDIDIGIGKGDLSIPYEILEKMKNLNNETKIQKNHFFK